MDDCPGWWDSRLGTTNYCIESEKGGCLGHCHMRSKADIKQIAELTAERDEAKSTAESLDEHLSRAMKRERDAVGLLRRIDEAWRRPVTEEALIEALNAVREARATLARIDGESDDE